MHLKNITFYFLLLGIILNSCNSISNTDASDKNYKDFHYPANLMYFSQDFYLKIRHGDSIEEYIDTIKRIDLEKLQTDLSDYSNQLAFWINIYNAFVQYKLSKDSSSFHKGDQFFKTKDLTFGQHTISLDQIEHGILRGKLDNHDLINKFKLKQLDYRIHFTMNCGASSCPAINYYKPETIERDLALAEHTFIKANSTFDSLVNVVYISEIFEWFKTDFGGEKGIINILKRNGIISNDHSPLIKYTPYNWSLETKKYSE